LIKADKSLILWKVHDCCGRKEKVVEGIFLLAEEFQYE